MATFTNGSHYVQYENSDYYEWWYFHFLSEDGRFAANIVLHETDIFGLVRQPYISISFSLPNGVAKYYKIRLEKGDIERNTRYLSVVDDLFYENENSISINIHFLENMHFKAVIKKMSFPLIINNGILYRDLEAGKGSYWVPFAPQGVYEGILTVDNNKYRLQGSVYHDHQWGNMLIQNFVSDWMWGNFCDKSESYIFFNIKTLNNKFIERYAIVSENRDFCSAGNKEYLCLSALSACPSPELFKDALTAINWDEYLTFRIDPFQILRSRLDEQYQNFQATYLRWMSDGFCSGYFIRKPFIGITEYLRIRK